MDSSVIHRYLLDQFKDLEFSDSSCLEGGGCCWGMFVGAFLSWDIPEELLLIALYRVIDLAE